MVSEKLFWETSTPAHLYAAIAPLRARMPTPDLSFGRPPTGERAPLGTPGASARNRSQPRPRTYSPGNPPGSFPRTHGGARVAWFRPRGVSLLSVGLLLKLLSTAAAGAVDAWVGIVTGVALGLPRPERRRHSVASALAGGWGGARGSGRRAPGGPRLPQPRARRAPRARVGRVWGSATGYPGALLATPLALALGAPLPVPCCRGCSPAWRPGGRPLPARRPWASPCSLGRTYLTI